MKKRICFLGICFLACLFYGQITVTFKHGVIVGKDAPIMKFDDGYIEKNFGERIIGFDKTFVADMQTLYS